MCLRGWNHSRRLLRVRLRKNCMPASGNPGKPIRAPRTAWPVMSTKPSSIIEVMVHTDETVERLAAIPELTVLTGAPLSRYTRFALGGPADIYAETSSAEAFIAALKVARESGHNYIV